MMTIGMMIGATMETSTATMALPSQWNGSTTETKTVLMVKTNRTTALVGQEITSMLSLQTTGLPPMKHTQALNSLYTQALTSLNLSNSHSPTLMEQN